MFEQEFPNLFQFFGCYFHEDWVVEYSSAEEVLASAILEVKPETRRAARAELSVFLETAGGSDDVLEQQLYSKLGCNYRPQADGKTVRIWLMEVQELLGKDPS